MFTAHRMGIWSIRLGLAMAPLIILPPSASGFVCAPGLGVQHDREAREVWRTVWIRDVRFRGVSGRYDLLFECESGDYGGLRISFFGRGGHGLTLRKRVRFDDLVHPQGLAVVQNPRASVTFLTYTAGRFGDANVYTVEPGPRLRKRLEAFAGTAGQLDKGIVIENNMAKYIWGWDALPLGASGHDWFRRVWRWNDRSRRFTHGRWNRLKTAPEGF